MPSSRLTIMIPPEEEDFCLSIPPQMEKSRFEIEEFSETDDSDSDQEKEEKEQKEKEFKSESQETCWTKLVKTIFKSKQE